MTAVHVLLDLAPRMGSLASDRQCEEDSDETNKMEFLYEKVSDLEIFESLGNDDSSAVNTNSNYTEMQIIEKLVSSSAIHYIASQMSRPQVFLVGKVDDMPRRLRLSQTTSDISTSENWREMQKGPMAKIDIQVVELKRNMTSRPGFYVDIGAPTLVVRLRNLRGIRLVLKEKFNLRPSSNCFRFAKATYKSLKTIETTLLTPIEITNIYVKLYVVSAVVPALLGIDVLGPLFDCRYRNE